MNIDNPWPARQDQADYEQSKVDEAHEFWVQQNMDRALEIMSQVYALEREYEIEFDCSPSIDELFNISRADVREWERNRSRKTG